VRREFIFLQESKLHLIFILTLPPKKCKVNKHEYSAVGRNPLFTGTHSPFRWRTLSGQVPVTKGNRGF